MGLVSTGTSLGRNVDLKPGEQIESLATSHIALRELLGTALMYLMGASAVERS